MPIRDYSKSNIIPEKLFRGRRSDKITALLLNGEKRECFNAFVADSNKKTNCNTVAHWAKGGFYSSKFADASTETILNSPKAFWILDFESRETSTVLKVMSEDNDVFDLRIATLVDLLRDGGIDQGGKLQGTFRWATYNGRWQIVRVGGIAEKSLNITEKYSTNTFNGKPKTGVCYADGNGIWYYLGEAKLPAGKITVSGGTITRPPTYFDYQKGCRSPEIMEYRVALSETHKLLALSPVFRLTCWQARSWDQPGVYSIRPECKPGITVAINANKELELEYKAFDFPIWIRRPYAQVNDGIRLGKTKQTRNDFIAAFIQDNDWTAEPRAICAGFTDHYGKKTCPVQQPAKNAIELQYACPFSAEQLFAAINRLNKPLGLGYKGYPKAFIETTIADISVKFIQGSSIFDIASLTLA